MSVRVVSKCIPEPLDVIIGQTEVVLISKDQKDRTLSDRRVCYQSRPVNLKQVACGG